MLYRKTDPILTIVICVLGSGNPEAAMSGSEESGSVVQRNKSTLYGSHSQFEPRWSPAYLRSRLATAQNHRGLRFEQVKTQVKLS